MKLRLGFRIILFMTPLLAMTVSSRAQSKDDNEADLLKLFEQASVELDAKSYATACPKLEKFVAARPAAIGAHMALGECYQGLGRLASAWTQYVTAQDLATKAADERATQAAEKAGQLRPRLATIVIDVPSSNQSIPGFKITLDGKGVGAGQWSQAIPVDAGYHEVVAWRRDGNTPQGPSVGRDVQWETRHVESIADGAQIVIRFRAPLQPVVAQHASSVSPILSPPASWRAPLGWSAASVGVAGLAITAVTGALAFDARSKVDAYCNPAKQCNSDGLAAVSDGKALATTSTVSLVLGTALLGTGIIVLATSTGSKTKSPTAHLTLRASISGLTVKGEFE